MTWTVYWIQKSGVSTWTESTPMTLKAWREAQTFSERVAFRRDELPVKDEDWLQDGDVLVVSDPTICDPKRARQYMALKQGDVRILTTGRHGSRHRQEKALKHADDAPFDE